jgi:hypothetical protein
MRKQLKHEARATDVKKQDFERCSAYSHYRAFIHVLLVALLPPACTTTGTRYDGTMLNRKSSLIGRASSVPQTFASC